MPRQIWLRPAVHAVDVDGDLVVLDVAADRYICLPGAGARLSSDRRRFIVSGEAEAEGLMRAGLAQQTPRRGLERPPPALPHAAAADAPGSPKSGLTAQTLIAGLWDVRRRYVGRSFAALLASVGEARTQRPLQRDRDAVVDLARRFEVAAIWAPAPRKCLVRSFLLLCILHRHGYDADWVLGVRTWPFAAHCWLQVDGVALDDLPERLSAYRPILLV